MSRQTFTPSRGPRSGAAAGCSKAHGRRKRPFVLSNSPDPPGSTNSNANTKVGATGLVRAVFTLVDDTLHECRLPSSLPAATTGVDSLREKMLVGAKAEARRVDALARSIEVAFLDFSITTACREATTPISFSRKAMDIKKSRRNCYLRAKPVIKVKAPVTARPSTTTSRPLRSRSVFTELYVPVRTEHVSPDHIAKQFVGQPLPGHRSDFKEFLDKPKKIGEDRTPRRFGPFIGTCQIKAGFFYSRRRANRKAARDESEPRDRVTKDTTVPAFIDACQDRVAITISRREKKVTNGRHVFPGHEIAQMSAQEVSRISAQYTRTTVHVFETPDEAVPARQFHPPAGVYEQRMAFIASCSKVEDKDECDLPRYQGRGVRFDPDNRRYTWTDAKGKTQRFARTTRYANNSNRPVPKAARKTFPVTEAQWRLQGAHPTDYFYDQMICRECDQKTTRRTRQFHDCPVLRDAGYKLHVLEDDDEDDE